MYMLENRKCSTGKMISFIDFAYGAELDCIIVCFY